MSKNPPIRDGEENEIVIRNARAQPDHPQSHPLLEGHPSPVPAKFGRRPFPRSLVILFRE